jgi:hypothetical protein
MPDVTDIGWLALMVALMVAMVALALWRVRQIRDGRADPVIAPDWTSIDRPESPATTIRWGRDEQPDAEDDHVGRPFPLPENRIGDLSHDHRGRETSP